MGHLRLYLGCFALLVGCIDTLGEQSSSVGEIILTNPIERADTVGGHPIAIDFADGALFVWPDAAVRNVAGFATSPAEISLYVTADGEPLTILSVTAEDEAAASALGDGVTARVRALAGFSDGENGFLFFETIADFPDSTSVPLASGICPLNSSRTSCDRAAGTEVDGDELAFNSSGLLSDGFVYLPRCSRVAAFLDACVLARVGLADVFDVGAYSYHNAFSGWGQRRLDATTLPEGTGRRSLRFSSFYDGFYLTRLDAFENRLTTRRARRPEGPYGRALEIATIESEAPFPSGPLALSAFESGDRLVFVVSSDNLVALQFRFHTEAE